MRALPILILSALPAAADPVAELAEAAAERGEIFLGFGRESNSGTCANDAFAFERSGEEWHLVAEDSDGVFRLRPWPEGGDLHLTHNPIAGGFAVLVPQPGANSEAAQFAFALKCPAGAATASDCEALPPPLPTMTHLVSLEPGCLDGGS
ncbi:hypothetical protein [Jannaschia aquimarina]|uniref:Uncharacterized protein n=1 Tax=Jannaschia aquimarina TaxID=935700 RepID=A0A0D1DAI9_9RHOB|nr:hypothetical protein [Jannaschia aquimarina]KIT16948.1 hypothetical protein jaqu_14470 [Jannaschia aquimarina]SNT10976.1 hypothetical protein SAMN05421775_1061 [Jannaschia aquimarina]